MIGIDKHSTEIMSSDIVSRVLREFAMWEIFIKHYSKLMIFSLQIQHTMWNDDRGIRRREWVCSRQGFQRNKLNIKYYKRRPNNETRCRCKACFHVMFEVREGMWRLTKFMLDHNHNLATQQHLHYLRSNRWMNEAQVSQLKTGKMARLRTCDIINLMVPRVGGTQHVGFTKKDGYNKLAVIERGQNIKTESEGLLGYLALRIDTINPNMYVRYAINDKDRLYHILWSDGTSQRDYRCFSNALAFDTTYKTNALG